MVKKNEVCNLEINGMTHEGQGVGRIDNFTVFVDGALEGERVEVKIIKVDKSYAVGKLLKILQPSPERTEPFCPVYKRCGGCSLQHADYQAQLRFKTNVVKESLKRIGGLEGVTVHPAIGMEKPLKYRNKAQYPVSPGEDPAIGFYAKRSHEVIDSDTCGIQGEASEKVKAVVRKFISDKGISIYDESTGKGLIRHIMVRTGFRTGEVMAVLVINGDSLPAERELVKRLTREIEGIKSIVLNINKKKTNVILGEKNVTIFGSDTITDYIGRFMFNISPLSFFQVNPVQTEALYNKVIEYAGLSGNEVVFDIYCGIGTISLFLSEKAGKVYGVEVVNDAIEDARKNAELNGVHNVEFVAGEAEKVIPGLYDKGIRADVIILDPPRKGCDEALLRVLADMRPERIVYVSCNPATLARDLKYMAAHGFEVMEAQPVDMFPHTGHVECVVLITRVEK